MAETKAAKTSPANHPQAMQLTQHSGSVTTGSGDVVNTTYVILGLVSDPVPCWEATVSIPQQKAVLSNDLSCGPVTYQAGLTIQYVETDAEGGYNILLSGTITDSGVPSVFTPIVIFMSESAAGGASTSAQKMGV